MYRKIIVLLILLCGLFTLASCGDNSHEGEIVVGMECAYEPFNYTEPTKTASNVEIANAPGSYVDGYDVQIAKIIADNLGLKLVIRMYAWDGLIQALRAGEIDLIIAGMSNTEERRQTIDFTNPYYVSEEVVLLRKDSPFVNAKTIDDFSGAKAVGQQGTIYADLVDQLVSHGAIKKPELDSVPVIVNDIIQRGSDVTVVELPVALGICANNDSLTYLALNDIFKVSEEDVSVSIGIRKDYALKEQINNILANISLEQRNNIMNEAINH